MVKLDIFQKCFVILLIIIGFIRIYFGKQRLTAKYKKSFHPILERINSYLVSFGMIYFPLMNIYFSFFEKFKFEIPSIIKIISVFILFFYFFNINFGKILPVFSIYSSYSFPKVSIIIFSSFDILKKYKLVQDKIAKIPKK